MAFEQKECMQEEVWDKLLPELPELYRAQESIHKEEVQLETPKINVVEISTLPREIKSEIPLEQSKSMLVQNVNLVSVITTFHAKCSILLPNKTIGLCKIPPIEISVTSRKILAEIPKIHTKQKRVLGSKLVRRAKATRLLKRKMPSICRPPPKPLDRQNRVKVKISKRI